MNQSIEQAERVLLHTYNRYQIVLDKGEGVYLYDINGKKYLDFSSGIAVFALGYGNEEYNQALRLQIDKLIHTSNYFYNIPAIKAAEMLTEAVGMERVFFTNSGTEAIEGAIKAARKYAFHKKGAGNHEIIAMNHSFHGRSMGALSVTGNPKYREAFQPLIGNIKFADFNNLESVKAQINENTCAVILEPIQGEGGIYPASLEFLQGIREICTERDILLIFDEIQCGMGRCGSLFAWQDYNVKPDIMTSAKALGCGVPVGAFLMTEAVAKQSLTSGDHGSTYGGNPLVCAAICKVLELFKQEQILENVKDVSIYLESKLQYLTDKYDFILGHRGKGLMQGLIVSCPAGEIAQKALEHGLILITAGADVIRMVPPLIIQKEHVDEMIEKLERCFV